MRISRVAGTVALGLLLALGRSRAAVDHIEVTARSVVLDGRAFGAAGSYEKITGCVRFKVKPGDAANRAIVDLDKAPVDANGDVTFSADVFLLRPTALEKGNGALLLEVPNRGGKGILRIVNGAAAAADPAKEADFGDGWLMREGYTIAWLGWQWDAPSDAGTLRLYAPVAHEPDGKPIRGLLRSDFSPTEKTNDLPLGHLISGRIGGTEYPVSDPDDSDNALTVRDAPTGPRRTIPRGEWRFPDSRHVHVDAGFDPGKIYELIYRVQDPVVAGLGLAAVRDFVSYLKHDKNDVANVSRAYALGISQTGRFLRDFVYEGFNADERGRRALDGVLAHVAGAGRGSFNHRFAQPSRDAQPMASFFYPTDLFPFTDLPMREPQTGETAGLLDAATAAHVLPKIFYSNTSYEYWGRGASLVHTTPDGAADAKLADKTRVYFLAGLQHFPGQFPPAYGASPFNSQNFANPNPIRWLWRAMISNMNAWVRDGVEPPPSRHPLLGDDTAVPRQQVNFPKIAGVRFPSDVSPAWRLDFGPDWKHGIVAFQPPRVGDPFPIFVPQVDADGNDLGGVRIPEMAVPLATYTGWNFRHPSIGSPERRLPFLGSYLPFPRTAAERAKLGDPRPSIAERYSGEDDYLGRYRRAADQLVKERWLLEEDVPAVMARAKQEWQAALAAQRVAAFAQGN